MTKAAWIIIIAGLIVAGSRAQTPQPPAPQPPAGGSLEEQMRIRRAAAIAGGTGARATSQPTDPAAISLFVKIETLARLPVAARNPQILWFYLDAAPLMTLAAEAFLSSVPPNLFEPAGRGGGGTPLRPATSPSASDPYLAQLNTAAATMTPQEVAERISSLHGPAILRVAARRRALQIARENAADLAPLIRADLTGADLTIARRAADYIHTLQLREFVDVAIPIYLANGPTADAAHWALGWVVSDPAVAGALVDDIDKNPSAIARHFMILSSALRAEPADPRLVKLLDSENADTRYFAAASLNEIASAERLKILPKLMHDTDLQIKMLAIKSGFALGPEEYAKIRDTMVTALLDRDPRVRLEIADGLATKRDLAAAQPLLDFLKASAAPKSMYFPFTRVSPTAPSAPGQRGRISPMTESDGGLKLLMAIGRLMDSRGRRLSYNTARWGPDEPQNLAAIDEFENWIKNNSKP
jgi:hypothetical protein